MTEEQIRANKVTFINLLKSTDREGIDELIDYLENKSDWFISPASTKYHGCFEGGLCQHSLDVYDILKKMNDSLGLGLQEDSMIIVALLHDLSKVNSYEKVYFNKKIYSPNGSKSDQGGRFDWEAVESYKTRDDKFVFANHEANSEFIIRQFIPLRMEESAAIMSHHGGLGWDSYPSEVTSPVYTKYPLAVALHSADMMAAFTRS